MREYAFPGVFFHQNKPGRQSGALQTGRDHAATFFETDMVISVL